MRYSSYIICTSPRSGSTLLCKLLSATGEAGNPSSLFHKPTLVDWLRAHDLDAAAFQSDREAVRAVFQSARIRGSGGTDIFGLRLQRQSIRFFLDQLRILYPEPGTDMARLTAAFGRPLLIHLTREDKLDQAVSYVKAQQTGLWHRAADGSELERTAPPQPLQYSATEIAHQIEEFTAADEDWKAWFQAENVEPLTLTYDAISRDPRAVLASVLRALGRDASLAEAVTPPVAKLADGINREWVERFRAERGWQA